MKWEIVEEMSLIEIKVCPRSELAKDLAAELMQECGPVENT